MRSEVRLGGQSFEPLGARLLATVLVALLATSGGCRWIAGYGAAANAADGRVDAPADAGGDLPPDLGPDSSDLIGPPPDMRPPLCAFEAVPPLDGNGIDRVWVSRSGRVFVARGKAVVEHENGGWTPVVGSATVAGDGIMVGLRGNGSHLYALHGSGALWRIGLLSSGVESSGIVNPEKLTSLTVQQGEIFVASTSTVYAVAWKTPASTLVPLGFTAKDFSNASVNTLWHDGKHLWTAGSGGLLAYFDDEGPRWNKETAVAATWTAGWGQNTGLRIEVLVGAGGQGRRLNGTNAVSTDIDDTRAALAIWGRSRFDVYAGGPAGLLKVLGAEGGWQPVRVSDGSVPSSDRIVDLWGNESTLVAGVTRDPGPSGTNQALILRCQLR